MKTQEKKEMMYSPEEVSNKDMLGKMTSRHIRRLCEQGKLRAIDVGTRTRKWWKIPESSIKEFKS